MLLGDSFLVGWDFFAVFCLTSPTLSVVEASAVFKVASPIAEFSPGVVATPEAGVLLKKNVTFDCAIVILVIYIHVPSVIISDIYGKN